MAFSVFEHLLRTERARQRMGRSGEFSVPVLGEVDLDPGQDPLLATNARGQFMPTSTGRTGTARFGFSVCPVDEERTLFKQLFRTLSDARAWNLRCSSVSVAVERLKSKGLEAKVIVVSVLSATEMLGSNEPVLEGFAGIMDGMKVLVTDLPKGAAIVTVAPLRLGVYTRISDHLGLLFQRIDQNVAVVDGVAE